MTGAFVKISIDILVISIDTAVSVADKTTATVATAGGVAFVLMSVL